MFLGYNSSLILAIFPFDLPHDTPKHKQKRNIFPRRKPCHMDPLLCTRVYFWSPTTNVSVTTCPASPSASALPFPAATSRPASASFKEGKWKSSNTSASYPITSEAMPSYNSDISPITNQNPRFIEGFAILRTKPSKNLPYIREYATIKVI